MGYNRDTRETKEYINLGFQKTTATIKTLQKVINSLQINDKRMLELATSNYSLTTDLADFISQKTKVGYRLIYKIVGGVVDEAMIKGQPLSQLTALEIIQKALELGIKMTISDEEIKQALDPKLVIEKRKNIGGSNSEVMKKLLDQALLNIKAERSWLLKKQEDVKKAHQKTESLVKRIIKE